MTTTERKISQEEFDRRSAEARANPEYQAAYRAAEIAYKLGEQVRQAREARGWTQSELAKRAGMKQNAISRFEAGDGVPTIQTLDRLAGAFGVQLNIGVTPA
ncbi:helix-turn-helix domain-containing protein [Nocardia bovistercoris]|uniref:Helix-turn-helix transcriptional regulator n=1 Tax=Nocardia bovistercoris TaxID=2785916 RepID=A0A931N304_9NOCA|nr:helix-turn-helix transcriptional regulator [Nocardia bovistercoris]MBH0777247.1 helix-turn-helix transcriptional regulator [Nocardia bovistercoris]